MGRRKKQQAAKRRGLTGDQRLRRRVRVRAELVYDPGTDPGVAAEILREMYGHAPVDIGLAAIIGSRSGLERLRAVSDAALARVRDPLALSLAADVAILDGRPGEAEEHASRALELLDHPELHARVALAMLDQGRVAGAIDVLDAQLRLDPWLERLQLTRRRLLEQSDERAERFLDPTPLEELQGAIGQHLAATDGGAGWLAGGLQEWIETGAVGEDEVSEWTERAAADLASPEARRLRLIAEWTWVMPFLDDGRTPLEALAEDERAPEELRRRADDWQGWACWGLWEVEPADDTPGAVLTDLVTGVRVHGDLPDELLDELAPWSALLGYVVPVDGVWRAGSWFEVASPFDARILVHDLLDHVMDSANRLGRDGRQMQRWARRVHDQLGALWLPAAAESPSQEAMTGLQLAVRAFMPHLVAGLREMQGRPAIERPAVEDEPLEAPVALPDIPEVDLRAWLARWPDEPLDLFEGVTPREAVERYEAEAAVEMLVRYLEHDAGRHGVGLDTFALRTALGLKKQ